MKIEVNMDSTSLGASSCILKYKLITVGELVDGVPDGKGGYKDTFGASAAYGICVHKYNDLMYKTNGYLPEARRVALDLFRRIKCEPDPKKPWLRDEKHFQIVCYKLWEEYIKLEHQFNILQVPNNCYWCNGLGVIQGDGEEVICSHCKGSMVIQGAANELTFKIKLFEDEYLIVWLTGTIDQLGKFANGCFAIRDWKTTSYWNETEYLDAYELSRQLRVYRLATKLESRYHPDSLLGRIGSTRMDALLMESSSNQKPMMSSLGEVKSTISPMKKYKTLSKCS
jgi:hypothetical protein